MLQPVMPEPMITISTISGSRADCVEEMGWGGSCQNAMDGFERGNSGSLVRQDKAPALKSAFEC